jgi:hypothetical protein
MGRTPTIATRGGEWGIFDTTYNYNEYLKKNTPDEKQVQQWLSACNKLLRDHIMLSIALSMYSRKIYPTWTNGP